MIITRFNLLNFLHLQTGSASNGFRLLLIFLVTGFMTGRLQAQESTVKVNHQGKDYTRLKYAWTAQWITHPVASTLDYGVFLFRRDFTLHSVPDSFIIYVSADNRYRLFVNGRYACFGPSQGDLAHYRYEKLDIARFLTTGRNVIAAEVVNFGEYRRAAQQTFQTAFILQGEKKNPVNVNTGTFQWKVLRNNAYQSIPFTSDSLKAYYAAGPGDRVNDKDYPRGWEKPGYDDSNWMRPKKATVEFAVGRGFLYGSTWFLVPRIIPFLEQTIQRFPRIIRSNGIKADPSFLKGTGTLTIPAHTQVSILLDQTFHTTGFPVLQYSKGKNSRIKITYAEALFRIHPATGRISDGNLTYVDLKGNRNIFKDKEIRGIYDIILPAGDDNRLFRPLGRRTYRFVQLDIETKDEPLILNDYHSVYTVYPFRENAGFESPDTMLTRIWKVAWRTLRNSAAETFLDPYYEQLQYIGDTRIEALVSLFVSGDDRLMRKSLVQFNNSRIPDGLTQSRYPSYITQIIPPYSLIWIDMIHDYYIYRNDPGFIRQFLPGMRDVLEWFASRIDSSDLPAGLEWWNFTDWAKGFPNGIPPGADDGYSANVSLQFVLALQNAAVIFHDLGWDYESKKYREMSRSVIHAVNRLCYDPEKGMYAETPKKKIFSQHTNIFAILTDALPRERQPALMEHILTDRSLIRTTIYFKFYLFEALHKNGMGNRYTELLSPWKNMIRNGMTTFGETDINPRSECHGWSASPCIDFMHIIAGISSGSKGFKTVIIQPAPGPLPWFKASMPHPDGMVSVDFSRKKKKRIAAVVHLPDATNGIFIWENDTIPLHPGPNDIHLKNNHPQ